MWGLFLDPCGLPASGLNASDKHHVPKDVESHRFVFKDCELGAQEGEATRGGIVSKLRQSNSTESCLTYLDQVTSVWRREVAGSHKVFNDVCAVSQVEKAEAVATSTACQNIIASATSEDIVVTISNDGVGKPAADDVFKLADLEAQRQGGTAIDRHIAGAEVGDRAAGREGARAAVIDGVAR